MVRWELTETIAISKFKATCLAELQRVRTTGQTVRMTRRGEPIADIVSPGPPERSEGWPGAMSDRMRIRGDITVPSSELCLSPISFWQLGILVETGRIELPDSLDAWVDDALRTAPMREAPLTRAVVRALGSITAPHRDPADRFLAATAAALDLQLAE